MSGTDRDEAAAPDGTAGDPGASTEGETGTEAEAETDSEIEVRSDPVQAVSDDAAPEWEDDLGARSHTSSDYRTTVIARTVARMVVPIILVTSIALLLQGHNLPGGGFIGGVLTATAFALLYVIFGLDYIQTELIPRADDDASAVEAYRWLFSVGLALAAGSGLVPLLFGYPFLTQAVAFVKGIPVYGELEVASAFAFDLGVYLTVVGALLTVLAEVGAE